MRAVSRVKMGIAASVLAVIAGCAGAPERFGPTESATALSPEGYSAAQYPVLIEGNTLGEVKVWSAGAYEEDLPGPNRTLIHVGFLIDNTGDGTLVLDLGTIELDTATADGRTLRPIAPIEVVGSPSVPPDGESEITAYFEAPPGVRPQHLDSFRVRWSVRSGEGEYAQRTPFLEQRPAAIGSYYSDLVPFYYSPFYDPFLYPAPYAHDTLVVRPVPFRHVR